MPGGSKWCTPASALFACLASVVADAALLLIGGDLRVMTTCVHLLANSHDEQLALLLAEVSYIELLVQTWMPDDAASDGRLVAVRPIDRHNCRVEEGP